MGTKFPHPVMYFTAGPLSQEPHLLLGSPLYYLIYLCYTIHPKDPGRAASQAHRAAEGSSLASIDFTSRMMVRTPSNTLLW